MAIFKLHVFYLPVYHELLPDDWTGEDDPRAPRMLFRGPTVSEFVEMFSNPPEPGGKTAQDLSQSLHQLVEKLRPMVRMSMGDWSLAALDGKGIEHLPTATFHDFQQAWMASGRPDEVKDLLPLGAGEERA